MENTNKNQNIMQNLKAKTDPTVGIEKKQETPAGLEMLKTKKPSPKTSLFIKIIIAVLFVLIIGVGAAGFYFLNDLMNEGANLEKTVKENKTELDSQKGNIDNIEVAIADVETFEQKLEALENNLLNYAEKEDLDPITTFLKIQDSDQDGLSDFDEITRYRSDPNKKDTDNDGYNDKEEVDAGYNPNGPGKLKESGLTEAEAAIIAGNWNGNLSSEVNKSNDLSLNLTGDGKVTGSFSFTSDTNIVYKNTVSGTFVFYGDTGRIDALLVNNLTVEDKSKGDQIPEIKEYKMNLSGTFSTETKSILGNWEISGEVPSRWPAGQDGNFQLQKEAEETTEKLEEETEEEQPQVPAQTVSVKAFSFGYSPSTIRLTRGERIILEITSLDVDHTFTADDLGIDLSVKGGETISIEYTPKVSGEYEFYCSVPGHREAGMVGKIIIEEPKEF